MAQIMFCQSSDPHKVSMLIPKMFPKIEASDTTAVAAVMEAVSEFLKHFWK